LTFTDPQASVFTSHPLSRFSYYFVIVRLMPTFTDLRGSDPIRLVQQMAVVEPFYSGVAYSIGALLENHKIFERVIGYIFQSQSPKCLGRNQRDPSLRWTLMMNLCTKAIRSRDCPTPPPPIHNSSPTASASPAAPDQSPPWIFHCSVPRSQTQLHVLLPPAVRGRG